MNPGNNTFPKQIHVYTYTVEQKQQKKWFEHYFTFKQYTQINNQ